MNIQEINETIPIHSDLENFINFLSKFSVKESEATYEHYGKTITISIDNGNTEYLHFTFTEEGKAKEIY